MAQNIEMNLKDWREFVKLNQPVIMVSNILQKNIDL